MLKCEFHCHAKEDKTDHIPYSAIEFLDHAKEKGFDVVAFTFHYHVFFPKYIQEYAKKKGILLIPGCEMDVEKCHVLVYHHDVEKLKRIANDIQVENKLDLLEKLKEDALIIAAHPYYMNPFKPWGAYLGKRLEKHPQAFDAVEFSHFYWKGVTMNSQAVEFAREVNKPIVGTGDVHRLEQFGFTFSMVDAKKDARSVVDAVKKGRINLVTESLPFKTFVKLGFMNAFSLT